MVDFYKPLVYIGPMVTQTKASIHRAAGEILMTKTEAQSWLRTFSDTPEELQQTCCRGHRECSLTQGGECLDDVIQAGVVVEAGA